MIGNGLRWVAAWVYYVCWTCLIGASLGLATHMLFALLFEEAPDWGLFAAWGVTRGLKYAGVWAGGLALVLCVMRARREYLAKEGKAGHD